MKNRKTTAQARHSQPEVEKNTGSLASGHSLEVPYPEGQAVAGNPLNPAPSRASGSAGDVKRKKIYRASVATRSIVFRSLTRGAKTETEIVKDTGLGATTVDYALEVMRLRNEIYIAGYRQTRTHTARIYALGNLPDAIRPQVIKPDTPPARLGRPPKNRPGAEIFPTAPEISDWPGFLSRPVPRLEMHALWGM